MAGEIRQKDDVDGGDLQSEFRTLDHLRGRLETDPDNPILLEAVKRQTWAVAGTMLREVREWRAKYDKE